MTRHSTTPSNFYSVQARTQFGALCWRMHRGKVEVLLITSRDTGRWVIPKGWPMAGLTPEAAAAREAWEEAGVEGAVDATCSGHFTYQKVMSETDAVQCAVAVYGLRVARLVAKFPERDQRRRKWFTVAKAARKVWEPELRSLMRGFVPPKPAAKGAKGAAKRKGVVLDQLLERADRTAAVLAGGRVPDAVMADAILPEDLPTADFQRDALPMHEDAAVLRPPGSAGL